MVERRAVDATNCTPAEVVQVLWQTIDYLQDASLDPVRADEWRVLDGTLASYYDLVVNYGNGIGNSK